MPTKTFRNFYCIPGTFPRTVDYHQKERWTAIKIRIRFLSYSNLRIATTFTVLFGKRKTIGNRQWSAKEQERIGRIFSADNVQFSLVV